MVCPSICLSVCLSACLTVGVSVCLNNHQHPPLTPEPAAVNQPYSGLRITTTTPSPTTHTHTRSSSSLPAVPLVSQNNHQHTPHPPPHTHTHTRSSSNEPAIPWSLTIPTNPNSRSSSTEPTISLSLVNNHQHLYPHQNQQKSTSHTLSVCLNEDENSR